MIKQEQGKKIEKVKTKKKSTGDFQKLECKIN